MNVRSYRKIIREMKSGESFYLNIINASEAVVDYTREAIKAGIIQPDIKELEKIINPHSIHHYMKGTFIFPQMTYIKL